MHEILGVSFECAWVKGRALRFLLRILLIDRRQAKLRTVHLLRLRLPRRLLLDRLVEALGADTEVRHAVDSLQVVVRKHNDRHPGGFEHLPKHVVALLVRHVFEFLRVQVVLALDHLVEFGERILFNLLAIEVDRMRAVGIRILEVRLSLVVLRAKYANIDELVQRIIRQLL